MLIAIKVLIRFWGVTFSEGRHAVRSGNLPIKGQMCSRTSDAGSEDRTLGTVRREFVFTSTSVGVLRRAFCLQ